MFLAAPNRLETENFVNLPPNYKPKLAAERLRCAAPMGVAAQFARSRGGRLLQIIC